MSPVRHRAYANSATICVRTVQFNYQTGNPMSLKKEVKRDESG